MTVIPGQITLTFCYLAEGKGAVYAKALRGPCLDNSACKLNDPTILGDRSVFRHGLADLNSIIKGTWAQLLPYASQSAGRPPSAT